METFGNRLKVLRKSENLTQKDFAKRLLISQSYLSGLENDNELPTQKLSKLICLEFGVCESWLVSGEAEMYDDVYENDKSELAKISNAALLQIMTLFSTESNVEYGLYAYSIDLFASCLTMAAVFSEDDKLVYLENLQSFIMNFERMLHAAFTSQSIGGIENNRLVVLDDIQAILACVQEKSPIQRKNE